jgi:hypothetical protein
LKLKLPSFTGNFEYIVCEWLVFDLFTPKFALTPRSAETGVCNTDKTMGVKASLNVGGALSIEAKEVSSDKKLLEISLGVYLPFIDSYKRSLIEEWR